ncbi:GIY-YIG nuclease family protein [Actinokineospora globicatena]|uniref:GIY-YIG nuclease family protein n=1 Tax=Actinokineospora globicatena TaxID=103729 RepID=UPI0020A4AB25|nr:GIY-YIG nuclease family protein [Actinokineospora globicatena]MCP2305826.1 Eco29kI restriction endonuclease [Actinokineospora globicatena]GLW80311.1 hypothetical protein Aglo01_47920 [Actinokineospora globicatena]GLW87139.1 hypothetical protein Aglo02_47780 [Actinokineospora globicatena]
MSASGEFRLSITQALADQLASGLADLSPDPLDPTHIANVAAKPGVYQLYENDVLVYVGKAEAAESLPKRLRQHHDKLSGRRNVGSMTFTCLYVHEDMHAVSPERLLIKKYGAAGFASWNYAGFGSKDPGKERDTTKIDDGHFDATHPINLDFVCAGIRARSYLLSDLLVTVKAALPFLFRYQKAPFHDDVIVAVPNDAPKADDLLAIMGACVAEADARWRIIALPGYVIMYPREAPSHALKTYPESAAVTPAAPPSAGDLFSEDDYTL